MSAHDVIRLIAFGCFLAAVAVAVPGWVTRRRTDSRRLTYRMAAWGFIAASNLAWSVVDKQWGLYWWIDVLIFVIAWGKVAEWWRKRESLLELERSIERLRKRLGWRS